MSPGAPTRASAPADQRRLESGPDRRSALPRDLRASALGLVAWTSALATLLGPPWVPVGLLASGLGVALWSARGRRFRAEHLAWLLVAAAVVAGTLLRLATVAHSPVHELAVSGASVEVTGRLTSDPVTRKGRFSDYVIVRFAVRDLDARGSRWRDLSAPALVIAPAGWGRLHLGETVRTSGRLDAADGHDLTAVLLARGAPDVLGRPGWAYRAADRVRAGVREAASVGGPAPRSLVPALVDGDDQGLPAQVDADFRVSGLTHLLAVSGTNLTLVVGALLLLARWFGVRAGALSVVGVVGVVGFVLLARPEPSVLRAAAMGSVALLGMGSNGRERGVRALGLAVLVLMLLDPWLATQVGFALSAMATAGILFLAPGWRDRLQGWLPRWVAEAIAVPTAAQLACTPVVAAISGQVSLVAVPANLLAAPVVGPATVLGLGGGLLSTLWAPLGHPCGVLACWCAQWLVGVASHAAALPSAAIGWPVNPFSLLVLTLVCGWLALHLGRLFARSRVAVAGAALAVIGLLVPLPTSGLISGWPPRDWVLAACDVGQGDGLLLRAGPNAAVVVDTGPDPALMDGCLHRMQISAVPLVVLTHFHADHVDGLPGVLEHRRVGGIEVTSLDEPAGGVALVHRAAASAHVPLRVARLGEQVHLGPLRWQVLAPSGPVSPESDSPPNDASIVLLVRTHGVRILMMGDEETDSQEQLAPLLAQVLQGRHVDVLKVAHHGSSKQDDDLVVRLHPRLAVISDGVDNDYGHPAPSTLALLDRSGAVVRRTDTDGDVAVTVDASGRLGVGNRMPTVPPRPGGSR